MKQPLLYTELDEALSRLGDAGEPAEYHGTLCGALCVQPPAAVDPLELIDAGAQQLRSDRKAEAVLQRLRQELVESLSSNQMAFAPLLPDDELPLALRVRALAAWCQGFLYGLSGRERLDLDACSEEAREIVRDFSQFTQAGVEAGDDQELEESAYAELVEYLRVGAQLLFIELSSGSPHACDDEADDDDEEPAGDDRPTLH